MTIFKGKPVYLEWDAQGHLFEIVTLEWCTPSEWLREHRGRLEPYPVYHTYDVDWCDDYDNYLASISGSACFPQMLTNRIDENRKLVPYKYWVAAHLGVTFDAQTDPAYCISVSTEDLPALLLDAEHVEEFLSLYEAMDTEALIAYWEDQDVIGEGSVVWCSICQKHYDEEDNAPCQHVHWCDACNCFSIPEEASVCSHRTRDGMSYQEPDRREEREEMAS